MTSNTTKADSWQLATEGPSTFSTAGLIRLRPKFELDRVSSSRNCSAPSSTQRFHGRVTGAVRCPAVKEERALRATATAAGRYT